MRSMGRRRPVDNFGVDPGLRVPWSEARVKSSAGKSASYAGKGYRACTKFTFGFSSATLSDIEHSVISTTLFGWLSFDIIRHAAGGAGEISLGEYTPAGIRDVREYDDAGIALADFTNVFRREAFMHLARSGPSDDLNVRHGRDVFREILVGDQDYCIRAEFRRRMFDDFYSV